MTHKRGREGEEGEDVNSNISRLVASLRLRQAASMGFRCRLCSSTLDSTGRKWLEEKVNDNNLLMWLNIPKWDKASLRRELL